MRLPKIEALPDKLIPPERFGKAALHLQLQFEPINTDDYPYWPIMIEGNYPEHRRIFRGESE